MKKILIIEDEPPILKQLKKIADSFEADVYTADNSADAYQIAMEHTIDIFLVDMVLRKDKVNDISGANFASSIRQIPKYARATIIFITSLEDPKLYAFNEIHCYQYIEKPFTEEIVRKALDGALKLPVIRYEEKENVYLRKKSIIYSKKISDIIYIQSTAKGMMMHSVDGEMEISYRSCKEVMEVLDSPKFIQCNRGTIVNRDFIDHVDVAKKMIQLKNEYGQVELGTRMKKKFMEEYLDG